MAFGAALGILALTATAFLATAPAAGLVIPAATVEVPFGCGHSYVVSQGHDTGSHLQNDTFAWDFRMPVGTPIVSAMDGEVRLARGDSTKGGCDASLARHANYVVVAHADGLETQYLHFSEVVVQPGQKVKAGELIGYSGDTGWACGAHLHFKLTTAGAGWNNPSLPAFIRGYGDPTKEVVVHAPSCANPDTMMASRPLPAKPAPSELERAVGATREALASRSTGTPEGAQSILQGASMRVVRETMSPATGSTGFMPASSLRRRPAVERGPIAKPTAAHRE